MFSDLSFPFLPAVTPAADVYETDGEFVVELEVPGYEEKDLAVELSAHTLTVKGEREAVTEKLRLHERLESTFERRFELPAETDGERMSASYSNGVLTLRVPKTAEFKPRKIEITTP
ncbi:MAG TPA: Hsp20/alpha crystallin family protein [Gaiellaceae bacterium]|nr:Hsp20/alpha crystallin family protein [Gaiellaceae bacterium]